MEQLRGASDEADSELDQAIALEPPTSETERVWSRSRGPFVIAVSIAVFLAFHALGLLRARPHKSIDNRYPRTPAMAAGIDDRLWTSEEIAALLD